MFMIYALLLVALLCGIASVWLGAAATLAAVLALLAACVLAWGTFRRHRVIRIALLGLQGFIALTAIPGGAGILRGDFHLPASWLAGTPFGDYTIPGLALLMVAAAAALAASSSFVERDWALFASVSAGILMAGYEVVEIVSIDSRVGSGLPIALAAQLLWLVAGLAVSVLAAMLWAKEYRLTGGARHRSPTGAAL